MLNLDKRPCLVGNAKGDISLTGIMLEDHELNRLLDDKSAWSCWYRTRASALPEPAPWTKQVRRFAHVEKFKDSHVTLYVGASPDPVALAVVKISNLKLAPQTGGLTELSLTCTLAGDEALGDWRDELADVQLEIGESV